MSNLLPGPLGSPGSWLLPARPPVEGSVELHVTLDSPLTPQAKPVKHVLRNIERELNVIVVPGFPQENMLCIKLGDIQEELGDDEMKSLLNLALVRLKKVFKMQKHLDGRKKFTHFVSIPVTNQSIQVRVLNFFQQINEINDRLSPEVFHNLNKLHLTLAPLSLTSNEHKETAKQVLEQVVEEYVRTTLQQDPEAFVFRLQGLELMRGNPSTARTVFARVLHKIRNEPPPHVQELADRLSKEFKDRNLLQDESRVKVKLHMTLLKATLQKGSLRGKSFDATQIFEQFSDFNFGTYRMEELHISEYVNRNAVQYYPSLHTVKL